MRHKWDGKLKRGVEYVTCVKCGCMKQRYYGLMLYFTDHQKDPFIKAPNCDIANGFTTLSKEEVERGRSDAYDYVVGE